MKSTMKMRAELITIRINNENLECEVNDCAEQDQFLLHYDLRQYPNEKFGYDKLSTVMEGVAKENLKGTIFADAVTTGGCKHPYITLFVNIDATNDEIVRDCKKLEEFLVEPIKKFVEGAV